MEEDYPNLQNQNDEPTEEELFEQGLRKTLPSTELRKIHTLARAGIISSFK